MPKFSRPSLPRTVAASLAAGLALAGCGGGGGGGEPAAQPVPFVEILDSAFSGVSQPRQAAVHDEAGWAALWAEHTARLQPAPPRPQVDWAGGYTVAALFFGSSNACQRPQVTGVEATAQALRVRWRVIGPAEGQACPAVVLTPVHMVGFANPNHLPIEW